MKLIITLYKDVPIDSKPLGIPDNWPASVIEVNDDYESDTELIMSLYDYNKYVSDNQNTYNDWFNNFNLDSIKEEKFKTIDTKTSYLISRGFAYNEKFFSLSLAAQNTLNGLYTIRNEEFLTYPIKWNTIDDKDCIELNNSDEVKLFYLTAVAAYRQHLDVGTILKDAIRNANTFDEVNMIIDNR